MIIIKSSKNWFLAKSPVASWDVVTWILFQMVLGTCSVSQPRSSCPWCWYSLSKVKLEYGHIHVLRIHIYCSSISQLISRYPNVIEHIQWYLETYLGIYMKILFCNWCNITELSCLFSSVRRWSYYQLGIYQTCCMVAATNSLCMYHDLAFLPLHLEAPHPPRPYQQPFPKHSSRHIQQLCPSPCPRDKFEWSVY